MLRRVVTEDLDRALISGDMATADTLAVRSDLLQAGVMVDHRLDLVDHRVVMKVLGHKGARVEDIKDLLVVVHPVEDMAVDLVEGTAAELQRRLQLQSMLIVQSLLSR